MQNYHIYEAIGRGRHSVVYKGRKKKTIQARQLPPRAAEAATPPLDP